MCGGFPLPRAPCVQTLVRARGGGQDDVDVGVGGGFLGVDGLHVLGPHQCQVVVNAWGDRFGGAARRYRARPAPARCGMWVVGGAAWGVACVFSTPNCTPKSKLQSKL